MSNQSLDDVLRDVYVTGLRNAHAVEHQAMALLNRQIERLEHYPEVEARLVAHREETETQIARLETLLGVEAEGASGVKDAALSLSGNMAALGHAFADDEILKNSFANFAFENFEVAAYRSLLTVARRGGFAEALDPLSETLEEEERMADWVAGNLEDLTNRFVDLRAQGVKASR